MATRLKLVSAAQDVPGRRDPRHALGSAAECAAAEVLELAGLQVLLRNWRRRRGELDIVARDGDVLVVAEVRVHNHAEFGSAAASVDFIKQKKIIRTTQQLLQQQPALAKLRVRFDVIEAKHHAGAFELNWIKYAFSAG